MAELKAIVDSSAASAVKVQRALVLRILENRLQIAAGGLGRLRDETKA
jgi:hypothetical protein